MGEEHYAVMNGDEMHELRDDNSGFSVPLPDPYDISGWDLSDPVWGIHKVALWGGKARRFRPILGLMCASFPQDGWWKSPLHPTPFLLSDLSIRRMTSMFTSSLTHPTASITGGSVRK